MKYRKKPIIVDAIQFVVWDTNKVPPFVTIHGVTYPIANNSSITVPTLEGHYTASNLDWIVKSEKEGLYIVKPDIFTLTYEKL